MAAHRERRRDGLLRLIDQRLQHLQQGLLDKSERAGQRVLDGLRACYARLRLKVNETKTAVAAVWGPKFLGYCLWLAPREQVKLAVAGEAVQRYKQRIR